MPATSRGCCAHCDPGLDQIVLDGLKQSEISIRIDRDDTVLLTAGDQSVVLVDFTGSLSVGTDLLFT